jgi:hypothetical protein
MSRPTVTTNYYDIPLNDTNEKKVLKRVLYRLLNAIDALDWVGKVRDLSNVVNAAGGCEMFAQGLWDELDLGDFEYDSEPEEKKEDQK